MKIQPGLNPWISIWTKPKETIRAIISYNPNHRLMSLCWIYGVLSLLSFAQTYSIGLYLGFYPLLILCLILAPLWGYLVFSVTALIVWIVGKWIGGQSLYLHVRSALAWSNVPLMGSILMWIAMIMIIGPDIFMGFPENMQISSNVIGILLPILLVQIALSIWAVVIYIGALAEVQQFSILRSVINVVLSSVIIGFVLYGSVYLIARMGGPEIVLVLSI
ncbi:MAG: YIP1 family protein, partial [Parachlamydiales bacterium]|nr:YIP1 family protein [Parachlamydiales bacterium]